MLFPDLQLDVLLWTFVWLEIEMSPWAHVLIGFSTVGGVIWGHDEGIFKSWDLDIDSWGYVIPA